MRAQRRAHSRPCATSLSRVTYGDLFQYVRIYVEIQVGTSRQISLLLFRLEHVSPGLSPMSDPR